MSNTPAYYLSRIASDAIKAKNIISQPAREGWAFVFFSDSSRFSDVVPALLDLDSLVNKVFSNLMNDPDLKQSTKNAHFLTLSSFKNFISLSRIDGNWGAVRDFATRDLVNGLDHLDDFLDARLNLTTLSDDEVVKFLEACDELILAVKKSNLDKNSKRVLIVKIIELYGMLKHISIFGCYRLDEVAFGVLSASSAVIPEDFSDKNLLSKLKSFCSLIRSAIVGSKEVADAIGITSEDTGLLKIVSMASSGS